MSAILIILGIGATTGVAITTFLFAYLQATSKKTNKETLTRYIRRYQ